MAERGLAVEQVEGAHYRTRRKGLLKQASEKDPVTSGKDLENVDKSSANGGMGGKKSLRPVKWVSKQAGKSPGPEHDRKLNRSGGGSFMIPCYRFQNF